MFMIKVWTCSGLDIYEDRVNCVSVFYNNLASAFHAKVPWNTVEVEIYRITPTRISDAGAVQPKLICRRKYYEH